MHESRVHSTVLYLNKEKGVIILATVAIYPCFESAENTPNMKIKLFFAYIKNFPQCFWKRINAGWDDIQI